MQFLEEMLYFIKSIKVVNQNDKYVKVKCFDGWQITISGIIQLWTILKDHDFQYFQTCRINQDSVENFFGSVRQQGDIIALI